MYTDQMLQYDKERRKQRVKQREKLLKSIFVEREKNVI